MATMRPRFQNQGPNWRCKHNGKQLGWLSCTAYSMAMGIDAWTNGTLTPTGCEVRAFTKDFTKGLTLAQVATVATDQYGVRVTVRTGRHAIAPDKAWEQASLGRGFVLQGNADVLVNSPFRSTKGAVNHAVWVNRVRGGTAGRPKEARVFDPAADGRHAPWGTAVKGPSWWPWETVLAFGASLSDDAGHKIGPGKLYAGFVPRPTSEAAVTAGLRPPGRDPAGRCEADHTVPGPPAGRSADRSPSQCPERPAQPGPGRHRRSAVGWSPVRGVPETRRGGEARRLDIARLVRQPGRHRVDPRERPSAHRRPVMTDPLAGPVEPAADTGDEDLVEGAENLPQTIFEDDLAPDEFTARGGERRPGRRCPGEWRRGRRRRRG